MAFNLQNTAGGLIGDFSLTPSFDGQNTAGGLVNSAEDEEKISKKYKNSLDQVHGAITDVLMSASKLAYGQNAASRWAGTPTVGLSAFTLHEPVYRTDSMGRQGQVIDASPRMDRPPEGLIGGQAMINQERGLGTSSLTPEKEWTSKFGRVGSDGKREGGGTGGGMSNSDWSSIFGGERRGLQSVQRPISSYAY